MKTKKTLIVLATLVTLALNIATAEAGKRSGGSRGGSRSVSSSMRSGGMKSSGGFSSGFGAKKSSFSSNNLNRRTLSNQVQSRMNTAKARIQSQTIAKTSTQLNARLKQGMKQHVVNHVQHHVKQHTGPVKCAPIKVCPKPKYDHCHKVWWHSWIKPCVKPVVIHCPVFQPVPVPVPVPVAVPVAEGPVEPVAPEAPRTEVMVGTQIVLDGMGFGDEAGQIRLSIAGLSLIAPVVEWKDNGVILGIPPMDMTAPTDAELIILHANGTTLQSLPITMVPAAS